MSPVKKILRVGLAVAVIALIGIQFVPVERDNPPVGKVIQAPDDVMAVLKESCWDCHSNETKWPWYSRIAPFSWEIAEEVEHGRKELNFSTFGSYSPGKKAHKIEEMWEEVEEGEMPPSKYLLLHSDAKLTDSDRNILKAWAMANGGGDEEHEEHEEHDH